MAFLWGEVLWLLVLVPLLVAAYVLVQRRRKKYALRYASLSLVKDALGRGPGIRRHIPPVLFILSVAAMIVAIARPVATVKLPSQEGTVILTVDVSGSMRADDLPPDRLEAAKAAAQAFVEKQPKGVRIGVVAFSDNAAIVQAPTADKDAVLEAIGRLSPQRGTAIGSAILTSLDAVFEAPGATAAPLTRRGPFGFPEPTPTPTPPPVPPGSYSQAVIVLLSDGQSNVGPRPQDVVDQAANRGVRIFTVGVGSPDGTVLRFEGRAVHVQLDEAILRTIAQATGGQYYRATSETDLSNIYQNLSTQLVFKSQKTEMTAGFAAVGTALLLVAGTLSLLWFNRLP